MAGTQRIQLLHADETSRVLASCYEVYRVHGYGFLESVYKNSLLIELEARRARVRRELPVAIEYKGVPVGAYRADLVVDDVVLLEAKTQKTIAPEDIHQLMNYLRCSKISVGLLFNFGPKPAFVRRVYSAHDRDFSDPRD